MYSLILTLACLAVGDEPAKEAIKPVVLHDYEWRRGDDPDQIHLGTLNVPIEGAKWVQVGTWVYSEHKYHPYHAATESWGYPAPLPHDRDGAIITVPRQLDTPRYHGIPSGGRRGRGC